MLFCVVALYGQFVALGVAGADNSIYKGALVLTPIKPARKPYKIGITYLRRQEPPQHHAASSYVAKVWIIATINSAAEVATEECGCCAIR